MPVLEIRNLTKHYPAFTLDRISFSLEKGSIMGLIGENGAGKSTTLSLLLGRIAIDGGSVRIFDKDSAALTPDDRARLGVVIGDHTCYSMKRLSAVTQTVRRFYPNWREADYRHYLAFFKLDEKKKISELSTGMQVKYQIALALSHGAELLILDEPTSGMDPAARADFGALLNTLAEQKGISILYSTHIMSDLEQCADSITYLCEGKLVRSGKRQAFITAFDALKTTPDEILTLEKIMLRYERSHHEHRIVV